MHDDGLFDERVAAAYDDDPAMTAPEAVEPVVRFLAEHAGRGRVLEFAVGTGRIALPLAATGIEVAGIELSQAMVARLRTKPGGADIYVAIGDMTTTRIDGHFALVYLVFNTINNLTTQAAQIACFANAAAHLVPGGCFVIEVGVPPLQNLPKGETRIAFERTDTHWGIDEYDVVTQGFTSHHITLVDGKAERLSLPMRYVWPSELDLMAKMAGLSLKERWGGWQREPFTGLSGRHVSVWQKPAG